MEDPVASDHTAPGEKPEVSPAPAPETEKPVLPPNPLDAAQRSLDRGGIMFDSGLPPDLTQHSSARLANEDPSAEGPRTAASGIQVIAANGSATSIIGGRHQHFPKDFSREKRKMAETTNTFTPEQTHATVYDYLKSDLDTIVAGFMTHRVLTLACPDQQAVQACLHLLSKHSVQFESLKLRSVSFHDHVLWDEDRSLFSFVEAYFSKAKNELVTFFLDGSAASEHFLKAAVGIETSTNLDLRNRLEVAGGFIAVVVEHAELLNKLDHSFRTTLQPWRPAYINGLLQRKFSEQIANTKLAELRAVVQELGEDDSHASSYDTFVPHIERSRTWEQFATKLEAFHSDRQRVSDLVSNQLSASSDPIPRCLAYLGLHFPSLSKNEFERMAHLLLADPAKASLESATDKKPITLIEQWARKSGHYMREMRIGMGNNGGPSLYPTIRFTDPYFEQAVKSHMTSYEMIFCRHQFRYLVESAFSASSGVPTAAMNGLVDLIKQAAKDEPKGFLRGLLLQATMTIADLPIKSMDSSPLVAKSMTVADVTSTIDKGILQGVDSSLGSRLAFARLSSLAKELIGDPLFADEAVTYVKDLVNVGMARTALEIFQRTSVTMTTADRIELFKYLLDSGPEQVKQQACTGMARTIFQCDPESIVEQFTLIGGWSQASPPTHASDLAACLVLEYLTVSAKAIKPSSRGCWPTQFHPFEKVDDLAALKTRIIVLFEHLFRVDLPRAFIAVTEKTSADLVAYQYALVEELFFILTGPIKEGAGVDDESVSRIDSFWQALGECVDVRTAVSLNEMAPGVITYYTAMLHFVPKTHKEDREYWRSKILLAREMKRRLSICLGKLKRP